MRVEIVLQSDNNFRDIKTGLLDAAKKNAISHAFIFEGSSKQKTMQLASELSQVLLETEHLENCSDFFVLKPEDMNVKAIRRISMDCMIKPFKKYKVYLIEDAMKMSPAMQNAFLKTLEEPPSHAVFILLCENSNALLDTVKSRCIRYFISETGEDAQLDEAIKKNIEQLFENISKSDALATIAFMDYLRDLKDSFEMIFDTMLDYARDILITKERSDFLCYRASDREFADQMAAYFTHFQLLTIIDIIEDARMKLSGRCSFAITCEAMLLNILEVKK